MIEEKLLSFVEKTDYLPAHCSLKSSLQRTFFQIITGNHFALALLSPTSLFCFAANLTAAAASLKS